MTLIVFTLNLLSHTPWHVLAWTEEMDALSGASIKITLASSSACVPSKPLLKLGSGAVAPVYVSHEPK